MYIVCIHRKEEDGTGINPEMQSVCVPPFLTAVRRFILSSFTAI